MQRVNLPPLSVNQAYTGRRFDTQKKKDFTRKLKKELEFLILEDCVAPYEVHYKFYIDKRQDIDWCCKVLQDIICDHFWFDDREIYKIVAEKIISKEHYFEFDILRGTR